MRVERENTLLFFNTDLADLAILIIYVRYTAMWLIRLTISSTWPAQGTVMVAYPLDQTLRFPSPYTETSCLRSFFS
jgi:hypothetical protein